MAGKMTHAPDRRRHRPPSPAQREYTVCDTRTPGLGVRVRPSGGVSFVLLHKTDGRSRRTSLGAVAGRSVDAMRRECHAAIAGGAPDGAARPEAPLFRDFVDGPWTTPIFRLDYPRN